MCPCLLLMIELISALFMLPCFSVVYDAYIEFINGVLDCTKQLSYFVVRLVLQWGSPQFWTIVHCETTTISYANYFQSA